MTRTRTAPAITVGGTIALIAGVLIVLAMLLIGVAAACGFIR